MADRVHPAEAPEAPLRGHKQMHGAYFRNGKEKGLPPPAAYRSLGRRRERGCCCSLFLCLLKTIITLIIALGIAALVIWLVLKPKLMKYDVQNVEISKLTVDTTQYTASAEISYTLKAQNPNKKIGIYYDMIRTIIWYKGTELGRSSLPKFYQGHRNTTFVDGSVVGNNVQLSQSSASSLQSELSANSVSLNSETKVKFRLKIGSLKLFRIPVTVKCNIKVPKSGSSIEKSCKLKRFW